MRTSIIAVALLASGCLDGPDGSGRAIVYEAGESRGAIGTYERARTTSVAFEVRALDPACLPPGGG